MSKPFFSIVTATFNSEKNIKRTINSLLKQNYKNFEWIIIDNNSKDNTVKIIRKNFKKAKIYIGKDSGIYDAWNKGISLANSSWISFVGAGDSYTHNALKLYHKAICTQKNKINLISSKIKIVDINNKKIKIIGEQFNKQQFIYHMNIGHVGAMHHNSLFNNNKFDTNYKTAADYDFFMKRIKVIKASFICSITSEMITGGVSNSYLSLWEKFEIHKKYIGTIHAVKQFTISFIKLTLRKIIKKY